jgi:hypothetical protein
MSNIPNALRGFDDMATGSNDENGTIIGVDAVPYRPCRIT